MSPLIGSTSFKIINFPGLLGLQSINWIKLNLVNWYSKKSTDDEFWLAQFEKENDLIYGPNRCNQSINTNNNNNNNQGTINGLKQLTPLEIINNYSEVLPVSWEPDDLIKFPLINPLRLSTKTTNQRDGGGGVDYTKEEELNVKRNLILDKANLKVKQFPSVTKVIGETMSISSRKALELWKSRMIEKLGDEGFKEYQQKIFRRGYCLHQNIANKLEKKFDQVEITDEISGFWKSLENVFSQIDNVKLLEKPVTHPFLCYRGIIDCVANYQNTCYLIDWKTSSKPKPTIYNLYDEPLQVVSYLGALNFDYKYDYQVIKAAIVISYEDGSPAHVHRLSQSLCKNYWIKWIRRLDQYWSTYLQNNQKALPKIET
ncbi:mitochondrial genome maintenance exonuclease 1-like [Panonychus citri]|uniref:mitochondrial genome maintenance exonuclease 1-like n=1 Tax=Panonychus citri TaxID=50023 RepID=UPI00230754AE|nr:mitochondrial genome maintenance exonuclease 1-like [Panonychus citri]